MEHRKPPPFRKKCWARPVAETPANDDDDGDWRSVEPPRTGTQKWELRPADEDATQLTH
ncbi:GD18697 [Drosophila simulans]|uniref:GD18697 n=1 Tax=Drosophila simulans TaxID=7240 RepID=B4QV73_DROSI|nr:GD18697 [Drosophila simulans]